jgi:hypothetical protein
MRTGCCRSPGIFQWRAGIGNAAAAALCLPLPLPLPLPLRAARCNRRKIDELLIKVLLSFPEPVSSSICVPSAGFLLVSSPRPCSSQLLISSCKQLQPALKESVRVPACAAILPLSQLSCSACFDGWERKLHAPPPAGAGRLCPVSFPAPLRPRCRLTLPLKSTNSTARWRRSSACLLMWKHHRYQALNFRGMTPGRRSCCPLAPTPPHRPQSLHQLHRQVESLLKNSTWK